MKEIDFLKHLLSDAAQELKYLESYEKKIDDAEENNAGYAELWKMRTASRQRIRDDLSMIRRVSLEVERRL